MSARDSLNIAHLASEDLEELARILARAYLRFDQAQEKQNDAQNEVDDVARHEQSSAPCEPNLFASRSTAPSSARRTPRLERVR